MTTQSFITHLVSFIAGAAAVWVLKGKAVDAAQKAEAAVRAEYDAFRAKAAADLAALKAKL